MWDVLVVGAGPAGSSAALAAARAGARTLVVDRATFPRYKTCGGGLVGATLASLPPDLPVPVRERIDTASFTLRGGDHRARVAGEPFLVMVDRAAFDAALLARAVRAGAVARTGTTVLDVADGGDGADGVRVRTRDGTLRARALVGADGTSSRVARWVGVQVGRQDLGLELELAAGRHAADWRGRLHMDWGASAGSYGWVFPKGDHLTVGVIGRKDRAEEGRSYLRRFVAGLGLAGAEVLRDTGHLTRCRRPGSPLGRGRVLVCGDAAGLLEPWTREGISFAVRSGLTAGRRAAALARATGGDAATAGLQADYARWVEVCLGREMAAGERILQAFERHPGAFHRVVTRTAPGWAAFRRSGAGDVTTVGLLRRAPLRLLVDTLAGRPHGGPEEREGAAGRLSLTRGP